MLDLHNHTTASDGVLAPSALIERAHHKGITDIAVTDHDTLGGLAEAVRSGQKLGVNVYQGIEISATRDDGGSLHVLGYGFDLNAKPLTKAIELLRNARELRNEKICLKLQENGMQITISELKEIAPSTIGRPHFARLMIEKDYVSDATEAFDKWLGVGCPGYVDKEVLTPAQAIEAIQQSGGIAVLAHPLIYAKDAKKLEALLEKLSSLGLDGVEVYYGSYSEAERSMIRCFADRFGLLPGGGSDFHTDPHPLGPGFPADIEREWRQRIHPLTLAEVSGAH